MTEAKDADPGPEENFKHQLLQSLARIRPYSRHLTRNRHAAEDLMQDTALKALEKHYQWQRGTNLTAWLRTIMRNRYFESRRQKQPHTMGNSLETPVVLSSEAEQPVILELQETGDAIEKLEPQYRRVLEMVAIDGGSYEDTAATLRLPVGTVRSRLSRARTALRAYLDTNRRYPGHRLNGHHTSKARPAKPLPSD